MIEDDNDNLEDFDIADFNVTEIINNLPEYDVIRLCDIIICDRYLGFNKELATACMEELSKRRLAGDTFNFEEYIEKEYQGLPKLEVAMPDLQTALNQVISGFKR